MKLLKDIKLRRPDSTLELMQRSHCPIFKAIGSQLCSHYTVDRRQDVTHRMTLQ